MRKILIFILLSLTLGLNGQMIGIIASQGVAVSGTVYADDLEAYSAGSLINQGLWIAASNEFAIKDNSGDNVAYSNTFGGSTAIIYNNTFDDNQYSEIVIGDVVAGSYIGVLVRGSGGGVTFDGYTLAGNTTTAYLERFDNQTKTTLCSGAWTLSAGDVVRLEVSGTTLSCYKNGSLITTLDTDGRYTDATYSSGKAGMSGYGNAGTTFASSWEGGDL